MAWLTLKKAVSVNLWYGVHIPFVHRLFGLQTKPHNLVETKVIRDLNPSDINKLISVSGMITRTSNVIPDLR